MNEGTDMWPNDNLTLKDDGFYQYYSVQYVFPRYQYFHVFSWRSTQHWSEYHNARCINVHRHW